MSLLSRLAGLLGGESPTVEAATPGPSSEGLAVAALLLHVARVDGRLAPAERDRLAAELGRRFGLDEAGVERLLAEGDRTDHEAGNVADLVERLDLENWPLPERRILLAAAYGVAAADGQLHEFEADWAWRLGHLLGLDEEAIAAARGAAGV